MPMSSIRFQVGINLIEVMVTVAITSIGLLGLSSLQLQANRSTLDSGNRSLAVWMMEDLSNRIRANAISAPAYDTGGVAYACGNTPAKICTAYHSGSSRVAANLTCSNDEQAASDLWEVACGFSPSVSGSSTTRSSAADFIAGPELTVSFNALTNEITTTLSWDVRSSGTDANGNQVYVNDSSVTTRRATISSVFQP